MCNHITPQYFCRGERHDLTVTKNGDHLSGSEQVEKSALYLEKVSGRLATALGRRLEFYTSTVDGPKTGRELKENTTIQRFLDG